MLNMKENKLNEAKTTKFENKQKTKVEKLTNKDKTKMTTVKIEGETNPKKTHQLSPKQINLTGIFNSSLMAKIMPPLEVESIFVNIIPLTAVASKKALACKTPF